MLDGEGMPLQDIVLIANRSQYYEIEKSRIINYSSWLFYFSMNSFNISALKLPKTGGEKTEIHWYFCLRKQNPNKSNMKSFSKKLLLSSIIITSILSCSKDDGPSFLPEDLDQDGIVTEYEALVDLYTKNSENTLSWDISDTDISNWEGVTLNPETQKVEILSLSNKGLSVLPSSIETFTEMREFYFTSNLINEIPEEFWNLTKLRYVYFHNSNVSIISPKIEQLENLEHFYFTQSKITTLPESFAKLKTLQEIGLDNNPLAGFPQIISELDNLIALWMGHTPVKEIPENILSKLTKLEVLSLYNCQLTSLPDDIYDMPSLTSLSISRNNLGSISSDIQKLTTLTALHCDDINMTTLPVEIGYLVNLTNIQASDNQLTTIPAEIGNLDKLNYLAFRSNSITSIAPEIGNLTGLRYLDLTGNTNLTNLPQEVCNLQNSGVDLRLDNPTICQ